MDSKQYFHSRLLFSTSSELDRGHLLYESCKLWRQTEKFARKIWSGDETTSFPASPPPQHAVR